jgi:hypothetical protein
LCSVGCDTIVRIDHVHLPALVDNHVHDGKLSPDWNCESVVHVVNHAKVLLLVSGTVLAQCG